MSIIFCTSVTAATVPEMIRLAGMVPERIDRIEIRADYIDGLDQEGIKNLSAHINRDVIFTCRSSQEGGVFVGNEAERVALLQYAAGRFPYVDVESSTLEQVTFDRRASQLIISFHDLEDTPHYWELQKHIFYMNEYQPDIIKIACFVKEPYDVTKLYRLMVNKPHKERRIVIGMGELGKKTRLLGPLLGSEMTFVTTVCQASAPGQYTLEEMKQMYKAMEIDVMETK